MPFNGTTRGILATLISFTLACAGNGFVKPIPVAEELPPEIEKELKDRFDVKELSSRSPSAARSSKKRKGKKNKKDLAQSAPKEFVYPNRRPVSEPIWVGEKLVYSIAYFGMNVGDFTFEVLPHKVLGGRKVYHIHGSAITNAVSSLIYRVNDTVESYIDFEGIFSHRFQVIQDESKQARDGLELNDSEKGQTFFWNRWDHKLNGYKETKTYGQIPAFSQDSVSALYYVRTISLSTGSVVSFPVVSEGKSFEAVCTVLRREEVSTPMGRVQAVVIRPEMKYQGILKKSGDSYLWLSDDDRRIPIRLEAKVKVGTVVADLKRVELGSDPKTLQSQIESQRLPSSEASGVPEPGSSPSPKP